METLAIISRYLNLILSILGVICMIKVVFRTEKQLDKVFKFFMWSVIVILIASIFGMDYQFGIVPADWAKIIFLGSRTVGLFLFLMAGCTMLKLIKDESCR